MKKKNIYKLVKTREMKTRNLNCVKSIKDKDQRVLVKEVDIKDVWKSCFDKKFNVHDIRDWRELSPPIRRIGLMRRMKMEKVVVLDIITNEIWLCVEERLMQF